MNCVWAGLRVGQVYCHAMIYMLLGRLYTPSWWTSMMLIVHVTQLIELSENQERCHQEVSMGSLLQQVTSMHFTWLCIQC
jgi:hypothetical protein